MLFLGFNSLFAAEDDVPEATQPFYQCEQFNLISINDAFLVNMMQDMKYIQEKIPLQDARLDLLHRRYPWFMLGAASTFLYEQPGNLVGEHYKPHVFVSLFPLGCHVPVVNKPGWHAGLSGTCYWLNYLDKSSLPRKNYFTYWTEYPKLVELTAGLEASALLSFNVGYRFQIGHKSVHSPGNWQTVINNNHYQHWFAEVNIGLQTMTRKEASRFISSPRSVLNLEQSNPGLNTLYSFNNLLIPINLINTGNAASKDIEVSVVNQDNLPVEYHLNYVYVDAVAPAARVMLILSVAKNDVVTAAQSGTFHIFVTDSNGVTAGCSVLVNLQP